MTSENKSLLEFLNSTSPTDNRRGSKEDQNREHQSQFTGTIKPISFLNRLLNPNRKKQKDTIINKPPLYSNPSPSSTELLTHQPPFQNGAGLNFQTPPPKENSKQNNSREKRRTIIASSNESMKNQTSTSETNLTSENGLNAHNEFAGQDRNNRRISTIQPQYIENDQSDFSRIPSRKKDKKAKYRKSKFPEQMLGRPEILDSDQADIQIEPEKKDFVFIDDELLAVIHQFEDDKTGSGQNKRMSMVSSRRDNPANGSFPTFDLKQKSPARTPPKMLIGENLMKELSLSASHIVNGGALRKSNYITKKNRVQFSGMDQIIPNNSNATFALDGSFQTLPNQTEMVSIALPVRTKANVSADETSSEMNSLERNTTEKSSGKDLPSIPSTKSTKGIMEIFHVPPPPALGSTVPTPVFDIKPIVVSDKSNKKSMVLGSMENLTSEDSNDVMPATSEEGGLNSSSSIDSNNDSNPTIVLNTSSSTKTDMIGSELKETNNALPTTTKRKIKRRHIQIQTRRPEINEVAVQVGASQGNPNEILFDDMTKELEQQLVSIKLDGSQESEEINILKAENTELSAKVEVLTTELYETKDKLETLSQQAIYRIQQLMEERESLMMELHNLRDRRGNEHENLEEELR